MSDTNPAPSDSATYQRREIVLLVLIALLLAGFFFFRWQQIRVAGEYSAPPVTTPAVRVQVEGAVERPGIYEMPRGSNVADLLRRSGVRKDVAELPGTWRDMPLHDEALVQIGIGADGLPTLAINRMNGRTMGLLFINLDINRATVQDLESLPGIGPTTARAIIEYREAHGAFRSIEDLKAVDGVGEKTIEALRFRVVVGRGSAGLTTP